MITIKKKNWSVIALIFYIDITWQLHHSYLVLKFRYSDLLSFWKQIKIEKIDRFVFIICNRSSFRSTEITVAIHLVLTKEQIFFCGKNNTWTIMLSIKRIKLLVDVIFSQASITIVMDYLFRNWTRICTHFLQPWYCLYFSYCF